MLLLVLAGPAIAAGNYEPTVDLAQSVNEVVANGDGTYATYINLTVSNSGNEDLIKLQLKDDLDIFGSGSVVRVESLRVLSGGLSLNPNFDGINDLMLLSGNDSLSVGESAKLRFKLIFSPGDSTGPFTNIVSAWSKGKHSGKPADDQASCTFVLPWEPAASFKKIAGEPTSNQNGTYTVQFTLDALNTGNEELIRFQFKDDLSFFGDGKLVSVSTPEVLDGRLTLNPGFDGINDTRLLAGSDRFKSGERARVRFDVTFRPADEPGLCTNRALIWTEGRHSGIEVDYYKSATFDCQPLRPKASFEKTASDVTPGQDGTFRVTFTLDATNTGNEELVKFQFKDSLDIFGDGSLVSVGPPEILDGNLTLNPAYDGIADSRLLEGSDRLSPGQRARVRFDVSFLPAGAPTQCTNQALIWTEGKYSGIEVDFYKSATFGCPPAPPPEISLTKTTGEVARYAGTRYQTVPITLTVTNTGEEPLRALQLEDPLDIFGTGQAVDIVDVDSSLVVAEDFIALLDSKLLGGNDLLAAGASETVSFTLVFDPADTPGPFNNIASAYAVGENSDQPASSSASATFLPLPPIVPLIELTKEAGAVTRDLDPRYQSVPITLTVTNKGEEPLTALQIEDPLNIFGTGEPITITDVDSTLDIADAFIDLADSKLLGGNDILGIGASATVQFTLKFDPKGELGPFLNTATTTAIGEISNLPAFDTAEAGITALSQLQCIDFDISKTARKKQVQRGELVPYEVTISNLSGLAFPAIIIRDNLPAGFQMESESAVLIRSGSDDTIGTDDDTIEPIGSARANGIEFDAFDVGSNEIIIIRYFAKVGTGVATGIYTSAATLVDGLITCEGSPVSVEVIDGDPIFEKTTIIGKVFFDRDKNGIQDENESGIPGVRLATVSGLTMETDAYGRYHLADVDVDRFERGANFIIKLDKASLPLDAIVISENPRVIRLTQATMSKINFAVSIPERAMLPCFQTCVAFRREIRRTGLGPILFDSGKYEIPRNFEENLKDLLEENKDKFGLRLRYIGHADSNPIFGRLAVTLGAGETGNIELSSRRARRVCEYVRDVVHVPTDCGNIEGKGSSQPVKDNSSDYEKSRNRRVEIVVEYYEQSSQLSHSPIHPQVCVNTNAQPYDAHWYHSFPFSELEVDTHNECIVHTGPIPPDASDSAAAKKVSVSGGRFGFHTLIAETLSGRPADGTPSTESEVTIYATAGDVDAVNCPQIPGALAPGCYPIEVATDAGSAVRINRTGDVTRYADPNNYEHIVVTPYRDETDQTVISGLRVMNDGIEPESTFGNYFGRSKAWGSQFWSTGDRLIFDPRLDVLARDQAVVDEAGILAFPIRFSIYTNYKKFIKGYRLGFFGINASGYTQELADTITFDQDRSDSTQTLANGIDLSPYDHLGYVLKATDCDLSISAGDNDPFDDRECHIDVTAMRLLKLRRADVVEAQATADELWGQSNLEKQTIPLDGGRVRVHGHTDPSYNDIEVDQKSVPVGKNGRFALEDHRRPGRHSYAIGGVLDGIAELTGQRVSADATRIAVNGGLFGCDKVLIDRLPGRETRNDLTIPAVTVVADPSYRNAADPHCPDEIVVQTAEKTTLRITAAGDVRPVMYPPRGDNFQQIVVTPFRDYTDSTVVSAVRISNEGFEPGSPDIATDPDIDTTTTELEADYNFVVALANLTVGANDVSGNAATLAADQHFDGTTFVDGRLAFYAKRRTEDYLLTAQLDSTEDELRNFSDNLKRKDPRRIFRQLDPDRYYPIYGDDSTTTTDVDTQGAFYLRLDWDKNRALWGNFNTGMTDTEFMQYNRSLYGANLVHENQSTTKFGDERTTLNLFGSEAQSVPAHVTFKATGGSLYYLRNTEIVQGSEKAWIEVRRRDTEQVVEREILIEGRDYEIDAIQGRMILRRPLSQVVNDRGPSIIRSTPLDGDDVFLLVDYEYVPDDFEANNLTYGGRGRAWINDYVAIGATQVTDQRNGTDYDMSGIDLTVKGGQGTYLSAEFGQSDARQSNTNFTSVDGGLSFQSQISAGSGNALKGEATAIEARIDLADVSNLLKGDIRAWSKHRDADFSTGRLGQGIDIDERGFEAQTKIGDNVELLASYTDFERAQVSRERVARIQADGRFGDFQAGVELRHEDVDVPGPLLMPSGLNAATNDGEALLVGARVGYDISEATTLYAAAQTVADDKGIYRENDLVSVGVNTELSERTAVSVEVSDGDRGSALTAGLDLSTFNGLDFNFSGGVGSGATSQFASRYSIAEGHELYGSYAVNPDRTEGARNLLTLGQRRAFGNRLALFAESQFGKDKAYANVAHVFGLDFDGRDDWRFSASAQFSEVDQTNISFERQALSLGAYLEQEDLKLSSRLEYREDEGNSVHNRQYLSSNSFTKILDDERRWIGQLNLSWTDDELNGGRDARFVELDLGQAYRPFDNDRLNILGKYSFLFDLPSEGQVPSRFDERSHLLSVEAIYDLSDRWELAGKLAIKKGEERLQREAGSWNEFGLRLASIRARYHLTRQWDGLVEYRWLGDIKGDNDRDGALLGLYRHVGENFKVGVGFNFTDFDERLRIDSYKNQGWFVDLVGKY